jgi:hypothetical protein
MNILDPIEREADNRSMEFIAHLIAQAKGDPYAELALIKVGLEASERHQDRLKARRLAIVQELRDAGEPMTEIAEAAGVNDSYLSRLAIQAGAARRSDRTRRRRKTTRQPIGDTEPRRNQLRPGGD